MSREEYLRSISNDSMIYMPSCDRIYQYFKSPQGLGSKLRCQCTKKQVNIN